MNKDFKLQLQTIKGIGPKRSESITSTLLEKKLSEQDLSSMEAAEIKKLFQLPIHVAQAIASSNIPSTPEPQVSNPLKKKGVLTLRVEYANYPQQLQDVLGTAAPSTLYVWGNLDFRILWVTRHKSKGAASNSGHSQTDRGYGLGRYQRAR